MVPPIDHRSAGFTLIELLISLALFALISLAGIALVETVVGVERRTDGRSDRLAEIQRGFYLVTADFEQLTTGPTREGDRITLTRGSAAGPYAVAYRLDGNTLRRAANGADRALLTQVADVRWRFFKNGAWVDQPSTKNDEAHPVGVELTLSLIPGPGIGGGPVRRVITLPDEP